MQMSGHAEEASTGMNRESIGSLWRETTARLGDRSTARWLCEVATGLDGDELLAGLDEPVTDRMVAHLEHMLARLEAGEPLQYVLGRWGFRRLDLAVDHRVLIPRPETEQLAEVAIGLARDGLADSGSVTIVDLGTGSGAIGLALADELPLDGVAIWLTDVSTDALDVARANLAGIGRRAANVRVAEGSWFKALPEELRAEVIVSNPPYVAEGSSDVEEIVTHWEPTEALFAGADGLDDLRAIITGAPARLQPGGWLVLEIGHDQGSAVAELCRSVGLIEIAIRPDAAGHDRIAVARRPPV